MGEKYLISNALGTFVFDESFDVVETVQNKDISDYSSWLESEKMFINKYKDDKLFYIGNKETKLEGIRTSKDPKKLKALQEFFKKKFDELYKLNLRLTKLKIKASIKDDLLIIQTIRNIEELNKGANTLSKRLREWYELYLPELSKQVEEHEAFVRLILENNKQELLKEIKLSAKDSMGADLPEEDVKPIINLAQKIKALHKLKEEQETYLETKMKTYCPNLLAIAGANIGAQLLAHAGDLHRLAMMPGSTIQLLGAESALFRHIRTGARCPKYGVLINHPIVSKAKMSDKGRAARKLADKICIAVKVDLYKGEFIGNKLRKQVEDQMG